MADWLFSCPDVTNYIVNNTYCLLSTLEFWTFKFMLLLSYVDLLVDMSETFCIMVVLIVMISSLVATLIQVHAVSNSKSNRFVCTLAYSAYIKYLQFKIRL